MFSPSWLVDTREDCIGVLVAVLYRRVYASQRAYDLAVDGVSFAHAQALEKKPRFEGKVHCRNWVISVARNYAIEQLRTESRRRQLLQQHAQNHDSLVQPDAGQSPLEPLADKINELLAKLPEDERGLLELRYFQEHTLEDLAAMGYGSVATVSRRIKRALRRLRELAEPIDNGTDG